MQSSVIYASVVSFFFLISLMIDKAIEHPDQEFGL